MLEKSPIKTHDLLECVFGGLVGLFVFTDHTLYNAQYTKLGLEIRL